MTGSDQGDDDMSFLARWSQRKREAKQPKPDEPAAEAELPPGAVAESDAAEEFDLSSLPKLEDMTGTTDITAFLRKGVPEHLRNAALRKSWALDPAIRNYVNPALEYAYDWNTPGGVPGSSEIGAGIDVARLVSQIMGDGGSVAEAATPAVEAANETAGDPVPSPEPDAKSEPVPDLPTQSLRLDDDGISAAPVRDTEVRDTDVRAADIGSAAPQQVVRRHGSAKPFV